MTEASDGNVQGGLTDAEKRQNVIRLVFDGSQERLVEFCRVIREEIPPARASSCAAAR